MHRAVEALRIAHDELAALSVESLSHRELLGVLGELEVLTRQLPAQSHRILARLAAEASPPQRLGAKTLPPELIATRLRVSLAEAKGRVRDAKNLGPRRSLAGEPLAPVLELTATAQAAGDIGPEHVASSVGSSRSCRTGSIRTLAPKPKRISWSTLGASRQRS